MFARPVAFALLAFAAFDWPVPWLDRAGAALLGFAFLALSVGASSGGLRRALPFGVPPTTVAVADEAVEEALSVAQRIAAYDLEGGTR